jgi:homoserine kinase
LTNKVKPFEIVVPGSISNIGPGLDSLAVAVNLYVRVRIVDVQPGHPDRIDTLFLGGTPPGENKVAAAIRLARSRVGEAAPGVRLEVVSELPVAAGLGSSAAAAVAGLRVYEALTRSYAQEALLTWGAELDGHPDNVSASLLGGFVVSCAREDGCVVARTAPWPEVIRFVVATPAATLETARSRCALPAAVPLPDAVFNLQRALLLVRSVESGRFDDLREALRDRWHQSARADLVPGLREALALDHPDVIGCCLSGSGTSVVALARADRAAAARELLSGVYQGLGVAHTMRILSAHQPPGGR